MNEIRSAQDLDDLELLRKTQPQWKSSRLEPFLQSAQQNVEKPIWGKLTIPDSHLKAGGVGGGSGQNFLAVVVFNRVLYYANIVGTIGTQV